ncbi:peroxiredoxin [Kordiimonas sediminis]|uniref:Peroxiredoxin n=1 Tax=Kordiimonas sediminis TaxID=1735581 RepID=A0A919APR2_9PROT|nr:peroxiredoxin [Kordiimonas sediminis]GHF17371.1 peroxiredoxin [Kordiimonas sediminis]
MSDQLNTAENIERQPVQALRINDRAPDFTARSTQGVVQLGDYRGKWLVFFSHPADFTPVCTSEFVAFEKKAADFRALNCELLGLSADSIYSHLAWMLNIEERFGVRINFPVIEDLSLVIAEAYGMVDELSPSTATVRSVFFIDPEGKIRALIHYPMSIGRSVDEILRVLTALVETHDGETATPEGWTAGDPKLLAPPVTLDGMRDRLAAGRRGGEAVSGTPQMDGGDWYFTRVSEKGVPRAGQV